MPQPIYLPRRTSTMEQLLPYLSKYAFMKMEQKQATAAADKLYDREKELRQEERDYQREFEKEKQAGILKTEQESRKVGGGVKLGDYWVPTASGPEGQTMLDFGGKQRVNAPGSTGSQMTNDMKNYSAIVAEAERTGGQSPGTFAQYLAGKKTTPGQLTQDQVTETIYDLALTTVGEGETVEGKHAALTKMYAEKRKKGMTRFDAFNAVLQETAGDGSGPGQNLPPGVTMEDVQFTAKRRGLTVKEVIEKINAR